MKLVDYDALEQYAVEYQERHKGDELTRGEFKLIDNFMFECPKTEAIPVEWIRAKMELVKRKANEDIGNAAFTLAVIAPLEYLISEWQKEQEAR